MADIIALDTPSLGDRSYLAHDGEVALVVDPQRDIDRVLSKADELGVRITHIFETHIHNDYVTGGFALAQKTGAAYHVNADDDVSFDRVGVRDGDQIAVSDSLTVHVLSTPGHTFTHLSFALESGGERVGVFTGGSLLFGSTGRPDLLGPDHTHDLVHHQYASARKIADAMPDNAQVLPTHGFGSFCSATQSDSDSSTIGQEKSNNPALTKHEQEWVDEILAGLAAWPSYYKHMAPRNSAGPTEPDLSPAQAATPESIRASLEAGEWVVDLRTGRAFAAGHVKKSLNFGIDGQFSTYLGWLIPWGTPITLLGETAEQVECAQRELVRIGIDRPKQQATGGPSAWTDDELGSYEVATFADLAQVLHHREVIILDVRREDEHNNGHIKGAINIPIHEIVDRVGEVPAGEVWVHCAGGYRASVAASIVAARADGAQVVAVDDSFDNAAGANLPLE